MARGRLTDASITAVREGAAIDKVVADYVTLKRAGTSLKGLCPFHDEKGPSFHVTPSRGFFHCFGCGEGGDVIDFISKIENLDFIESIERLADRFRIELTFEETGKPGSGPDRTETRAARARLVAAHTAAAEFYATQLHTPAAVEARRFLSDRGFDRHAAAEYGCGYSPDGWDILIKHLTGLGFTIEELKTAGLVSDGKNSPIDRFRGRLMFPIRDQTGDIIGFGARKLSTDPNDKSPKYLNTSETPIYKKSRVLFGLDKARKTISKERRVVVVEGYTDVMACHLAGETTAVATCGTAFGEEHIRIIRRLLGDDGSGGEVIYTFDGDNAGQKAALRAFTMDDHFQTRTSVAVEPSGMDPCEVRLAQGPEGVRALLDNRVPLFEFAIKATLSQFDLNTPEGRTNALNEVMPVLTNIKHVEMREGYVRQLSRWTGADPDAIRAALRRTNPTQQPQPANHPEPRATADGDSPQAGTPDPYEHPASTVLPAARDVLKVMLQHQRFVHLATSEVKRPDFGHPTYKAVWDAIMTANNAPSTDPSVWVRQVLDHAASPAVATTITELSVEPLRTRIDMNQEVATKTYLTLVAEACVRRRTYIQRAIANPDLPAEKADAMIADLTRTQQREANARARLHLIDGNDF